MKVFIFALIAAVGNALFVYGQRGSQTADNPFFFLLVTLSICTALILICALASKSPLDSVYVIDNMKYILIQWHWIFYNIYWFLLAV